MKVLFLIDTLEVGGAEKSLLEIIISFHQVQSVMCHLYPGQTLKPAYEQVGVQVISLNLLGKYAFGKAIKKVKAVAQQEKVDLIHTTLFRADVVGRLVGRELKLPVVNSLVNEPYAAMRWDHLSPLGRLKLYGIQMLDAWSARWACHFIANSATVKATNARALGVPLEKISVIYRGRDPAPFVAASFRPSQVLRGDLDLATSNQVMLNVARLLDRKGQAELIKAMPLVLRQFPQARLLIAGEGPYRPALESLIQQLNLTGKVCLLGQRNDIPALLGLADLFVFPSFYEGYPGALVEAMFAAKPIIASDIPVHREAINPGKTGLLTPIADTAALAQGIIWMLEHPEKARCMGEKARQVAMERFHIEQIAAQYEEIYETVLRQGNKLR